MNIFIIFREILIIFLGKLISKIRANKNIPIKYLTRNCMSISTYEYFTEGKIDISINKFFTLINRLNLNWKDFRYINNNYRNPSLILSKDIKSAILSKNIKKLELIRAKAYSNLKEINGNKIYNRYFHLYCLLNIFIEKLTKKKIQNKYKEPIKEYLLKRYTWTYYELSLFNSLYFIFSPKIINAVIKRVEKDLKRYNNFNYNESEEIRFLINITNLCIKKKKLKKVSEIIKILKNIKIPENMTLERLILRYFIGLYQIINNNRLGISLVDKAINYLKFTNPNSYYPAIKSNYYQTLKIYGIKDKLKNK